MKYVYMRFSSIVWFLQFLSNFLWVLQARRKLILSYTKYWVYRATFLASTCSSLVLRSKRVHWNYRHFFRDFKPKSAFSGLIKVRLLVKTLLMEIILTWKGSTNQIKTKKLCFGYFWWFLTSAWTLWPRNTYIYVFQVLFGFCNFEASSCGF